MNCGSVGNHEWDGVGGKLISGKFAGNRFNCCCKRRDEAGAAGMEAGERPMEEETLPISGSPAAVWKGKKPGAAELKRDCGEKNC